MNNFDFTYIIDDDAIFVLVFKKILNNIENFNKIQNMKNGLEGLEGLKAIDAKNEQFPDIIFLDLNMPVMDGWQFLEATESQTFVNKLNVYVISSTIDKSEIERLQKFRAVKNFIQKPTNSKQLIESLERAAS